MPEPEWRWEKVPHNVPEEELLKVPSWRRDTLQKDQLRRDGRADLADEPKGMHCQFARGQDNGRTFN